MPRRSGGPLRSFVHALRGVCDALARERNLRVHLATGALALFCALYYYGLTRAETALLVLTIGFVIAAELMNTAVERTVDLATAAIHPLARIAKDVAAGAVLVSAAAAVAVGFLLFWDVPTLARIWRDIAAHPLTALIAAAIAIVWIILPGRSKK